MVCLHVSWQRDFISTSFPTCKHDAKHLLRTMHFSRYLENYLKDVVDGCESAKWVFRQSSKCFLAINSGRKSGNQKTWTSFNLEGKEEAKQHHSKTSE